MQRLQVGLAQLRGKIQRYARRYDLVELRAEPGTLPRMVRLREWAAAAPSGFTFSARLPRAVCALEPGDDFDGALAYARRVMTALQPGWLVLHTPASVTPGSRSRRRLLALADELRQHTPTSRIAWEPHGPWEPDTAARFAAEHDMHLIQDAAREEPYPAEVVYTRLLAIGTGRINPDAAERAGERLADRREAYVVFDGASSVVAARILRETAQALAPDFLQTDEVEEAEETEATSDEDTEVDADAVLSPEAALEDES